MATREPSAGFNLLLIRNFFDAATCASILAEMRAESGAPAVVYGAGASGNVDERVRKTTRLTPSPPTVELVMRRLLESKQLVEDHFRVSVGECEDPQFLRYEVGGFFVAHQDGNTSLLRLDRERIRTISVIIFLSDQSETPRPDTYCGGSLVFHGWGSGMRGYEDCHRSVSGETGMLVAFRAETTHEVTPVEHGERYTIACWYR